MDWGRYFAAAVLEFNQPRDQAWGLTPQEFWLLHDWKAGRNGKAKAPPVTKQELAELMERFPDG